MGQNPFFTLDDQEAPASVAPSTATPLSKGNPFNLLESVDDDQQRRMRAARSVGSDTTPDRSADVQRLSVQTGVPPAVVERNYDSLKSKLDLETHPYAEIQRQTPAVAEWSTQPQHAAVAHDDMANMGYLEWLVTAPGRAFAQQLNQLRYSELRYKGLFQPLTREEQDAMNAFKFHGEQGGNLGVGDSWFRKAVTGAGHLLAQSVEPSKYALAGFAASAPIGAAGGSILPGVGTAAGAVTTGLYGARAGMLYGVFKSTAMQETAGAYDEISEMRDELGRPIDPQVAKVAALTVGGLNGLIEQYGVEAFVKRVPGLDKLAKGMGRSAVKAALTNPTVRAAFARIAKEYGTSMTQEVATEVAQRAITMTGEELAKYAEPAKTPGMAETGNINLFEQPRVPNADGSTSTIDSLSVNIDGKEVLLPTVTPDGRHFTGPTATEQAVAEYTRTGRHLGIFETPEQANKFAQQLHEDYAAGRFDKTQAKRSGPQFWDELVQEAVQAVPEFAFGMLPGPVHQLTRDAMNAKRAEQAVTLFTALGEGAEQSKTVQRLPAAVQQLVADATKDGPIEHVFAPLDTWDTYWQKQGLDPEAVATELTGDPAAYAQAQQTQNIKIPTAAYAARLAGTEHNGFLRGELRLGDPDAMNGRESAELRATIEQEQQRILDLAKQQSPEAQALSDITTQIEAQLIEKGNVPRETARTSAQALAGIANLSQRAGFDPADIFAGYGLEIRRGVASDLTDAAGLAQAAHVVPPGERNALDDAFDRITARRERQRALGGLSALASDGAKLTSPNLTINASGESAASVEALSRQASMRTKGEQFVVYDRAGRRRVLLGPDAVDYVPARGETYGVEDLDGFRPLTENGGRVPGRSILASRLGSELRRILGQPTQAGIPTGVRVQGEQGQPNATGESAHFAGYQAGLPGEQPVALYTVSGGESHGSTIDADQLAAMGIPLPPTPPLLTYFQQTQARTPALARWFGNSVVVDETGAPKVVYHGTTAIFTAFDQDKANVESDFGAGFYFTSSPDDVEHNYATVGPDLTNKIERRAEQLAQETDREYNDPEVVAAARAEFVQQEGLTVPVFLKIENPATVGGEHETRLTYEAETDDDGEFTGQESGSLVDFVMALRNIAESGVYYDADVNGVIGKLVEAGLDGDVAMSDVMRIIRTDETFGYATNENGDLVSNEIVRQALEATGFDGIIDHTVNDRFGTGRQNMTRMQGMGPGTVHYVVFDPTQIKSATGNETFDPQNPNILFQSANEPSAANATFYSKLDRVVQDSKQAKGTGAQWKGMIANSKIGINRDEFAITRIDDLEDGTVYTKDEVLAYMKQNRPKVNVVVLEGPNEPGEGDLDELESEIADEYESSAMDDVDWDDYLGTATVVEEDVEDEVLKVDERGDPVLDEDGDEIYETVTETRYYPAIEGGYKKRRRGYGVESRDDIEVIEDADAYDTEREAERAAERYIRGIDREPFYEMVSESVREGLDWGDIHEEALRRWRDNNEGGGTGGRYSDYVLEPEANEDTYQEVFLTAGVGIEKPPPVAVPLETLKQNIAQTAYTQDYAALTDEERAWVDQRAKDLEHDNALDANEAAVAKATGRPATYAWKDGHDLYNDVENPIVRMRINERTTIGEPLPPSTRQLNQQVMQNGIDAENYLREVAAKYNVSIDEIIDARHRPGVEGAITEHEQNQIKVAAFNRESARRELRAQGEAQAQQKFAPGAPVLFVEEVQPPRPEEQPKMPPIFVKNWREMAFKYLLREAAARGLHAVAWTTGEQQAARYSLTRAVDKISFGLITPDTPAHQSGARYFTDIGMKSGSDLVLQMGEDDKVLAVLNDYGNRWSELKGQPLANIIGTELAAKVKADANHERQDVSSIGLRMGGEGLRRLYNFDFVRVVNALPAVKKNGGRVGTVQINVKQNYLVQRQGDLSTEERHAYGLPLADDPAYATRAVVLDDDTGKVLKHFDTTDEAWTWTRVNAVLPTHVPALIITEELRQAVLGGQALFQPESNRYEPVSGEEVLALNDQLDAVVAGLVKDLPPWSGVEAHVTKQGELFVDGIEIAKGHRDQGLGTALMRGLMKFADQHNMQMALTQSPEPRKKTALERFYRRLGFVRNGTSRFYDPTSHGTWVRPAINDRLHPRREKQETVQGVRGAIQFEPNRKTTIWLFENANLSTFLHETGHFYLELMGDLVDKLDMLDPEKLTASQLQVKADYAAILKHLGVTARNEIERSHHELFARSFETYLMEGKAPSAALRPAFGRFRSWLSGIYRSLLALNAPLTKDVRQVFDRILASDEAIADAEQAGNLTELFLTPEQAGMSHERFALYRSAVEEASAAAREHLDQQLMAEVQREQTAEWKARRAEVKTAVTTQVQAQPVYRAIAAMQRGTTPAGVSLVEGEAPVPLKLSKAMIVAQFGKERLKGLPRTILATDGGIDPGVIAEHYGFSSSDELLAAIVAAPPIAVAINHATDAQMLTEFGSMLLDGSVHEQAQAAVADKTREVVLRDELKALARLRELAKPIERQVLASANAERAYERRWLEAEAKLRIAIAEGKKQDEIDKLQAQVDAAKRLARVGPAQIRGALPSVQELRDGARAAVMNTRVRDLDANSFWSAARKASQKATEAAARQDFDDAIKQKHQEIISLALYRATVDAKREVETRVRQAKAIGAPGSMAKLRLAGETYHDQVAAVLDRFDFVKATQAVLDRRASLFKWVQGQEAQGIAIDLPDTLLDEARKVNYSQLTVDELVGITDGLKQLVHVARFKNRLLKNEQTRQLKRLATQLDTSIRANKGTRALDARDRRQSTERKRKVQGVLASHRKLASLLREMDGFVDGGPMWSAIMRPLNAAADREAEMNATATTKFAALVEAAYPGATKRKLYEKTFIPAIKQSLSKMERVMIALNWGNEGNRDRIMRAEKWSESQVQAVLDTLDARDAQFVQGIFDFIGGYWPEIAAKQTRVTGVMPEKVDAKAFRIGTNELAGGYFPLKYDDRMSASAASMLDLEAANLAKQAAFSSMQTRQGHTKARAESVNEPVRLDFGVISEHVQQVIHDLSHHETLIDVGRILANKTVRDALYETHGDITYKAIKNTVRDIAFGDLPAANGFERAFNHVRTGSTVIGLGWSVTTAIMQPLGLLPAMQRVGVGSMGRALATLLGSPHRMNAQVEWIYEKSLMMKNRGRTQQRELNEIRNQFGIYSGQLSGWVDDALSTTTFNTVTKQGIADSFFWMIAKMQQTVDVPTWMAAYENAMNEHADDEPAAIAIADQAVLDTQGGGQVKDLASVQRGGPMLKLWTNFYSYFNVLYNQAVEAGKRTKFSNPVAVGRLAVDYMLLFILPATFGYFIRQAMKPGDPDDQDAKHLAVALVRENLSYLMGMVVGLRELGGAVQGYYGWDGPAGARIFKSATETMKQVSQGEVDEALIRSLNDVAGILLHYPAGQVWRTGNGIAAIAEGKAETPLVLITGPEKKK